MQNKISNNNPTKTIAYAILTNQLDTIFAKFKSTTFATRKQPNFMHTVGGGEHR